MDKAAIRYKRATGKGGYKQLCKKCGLPRAGHTCKFAPPKPLPKPKKAQRDLKYKCTRCGEPLKGHTCPFKDSAQNWKTEADTMEVLFPLHVFIDQVHGHLQESSPSTMEREFLLEWAEACIHKFAATHELARMNFSIANQSKALHKQVRKWKDDMATTETKIKKARLQMDQVRRTLDQRRADHATASQASRFLESLQNNLQKS